MSSAYCSKCRKQSNKFKLAQHSNSLNQSFAEDQNSLRTSDTEDPIDIHKEIKYEKPLRVSMRTQTTHTNGLFRFRDHLAVRILFAGYLGPFC